MKFLALERPVGGATLETMRPLLKREARRVWELQKAGVIREIYFTPAHDAVLVLECDDEPAARDALNSLPLVSQQQIRFEVVALLPYTGFDRLLVSDAGSG
ncbi:MAG TPA: superoxide dismutase [Verrucomicrobiae bacterium]